MDEDLCYQCFSERYCEERGINNVSVKFWPGEGVCSCCGEYAPIVQGFSSMDDEDNGYTYDDDD